MSDLVFAQYLENEWSEFNQILYTHFHSGERGGLVVNASDSGSRGRGFEPHSGQTVLCL